MDRRKQIISWIKNVLETNLSGIPYRAFIFGSQANSNILKRADIDIGIIADMKIADYRLANIDAAMDNLPILYNIDIVDFNKTEPAFNEVALKNVEAI